MKVSIRIECADGSVFFTVPGSKIAVRGEQLSFMTQFGTEHGYVLSHHMLDIQKVTGIMPSKS
jgi:hypothetical protein